MGIIFTVMYECMYDVMYMRKTLASLCILLEKL